MINQEKSITTPIELEESNEFRVGQTAYIKPNETLRHEIGPRVNDPWKIENLARYADGREIAIVSHADGKEVNVKTSRLYRPTF